MISSFTTMLEGKQGKGDQRNVIDLGRRYFSRLELLSKPEYLADEQRTEQVAHLLGVLKRRVLRRGTAGCLLLEPEFDISIPSESVRQISSMMIQLIEDCFGSVGSQHERLDFIGQAHDLFAWGGLSMPCSPGVRVPNNVPDGATIFFFPEFALLALELGIDAEFWRQLLPILTRMPALYLRVHELGKSPRLPMEFDDFGIPPYSSDYEADLRMLAARLKSRYEGLSPEQLSRELDLLSRKAFTNRVR